MPNLKEQIIKFRDFSRSVAEAFRLYYDKLEYTGFSGAEPYLSEEIIKDLKSIITDTKLSEYASKSSYEFEDLFNIYADIVTIQNKLSKNLTIFNENQIDITKQGSYTSTGTTLTMGNIKDIIETFENISNIYQSFKSEMSLAEFSHIILHEITNEKLINIKIKDIENINGIYFNYVMNSKGNLVIDLYSYILHQIIINTPPDGKEIIKYVNKFIEKLKSQVLETEKINSVSSQNKTVNTVQNLIQMHNLVPVSMSMPLENLLSILKIKAPKFEFDTNINTYFNNISKILSGDKKFGFIIIFKLIKNSLEYNIWSLIDLHYLEKNKLLQPSNVGLNRKILERYQTIVSLNNKGRHHDQILIIDKEFTEIIEQNYFYIIESIDGENYRLLTPWIVERKNPIYYTPASWLENINNKKYSPSRRIESYNILLEEEIMSHLKKPFVTMELLNRDEIQKEETYWKSLRDRIKQQMIRDFLNLFDKNFIDGDFKINTENVTNLFLSESLYKSALNHITENIELDNINDLSGKIKDETISRFQLELVLSYFYDLSGIQRGFKRDVEIIYKKEYYKKINAIIGEKISDAKVMYIKNKIKEIYELILDEILEKFINKRSGIYLTIQKKFDILRQTLLK